MMKKITLCALSLTGMLGLTQPALAEGSLQHSGQSINHSAQAVGHMVVGGVKLTSGAVAIPLGFSAGAGKLSGQASEALWEDAHTETEIGAPLTITDETIVLGPAPDAALKD